MTTDTQSKSALLGVLFPAALLLIAAYFAVAAVQGNHGLFRQIQIEAEREALQEELTALRAEVARMEVLTRRLSDDYLDLDLLDEQARDVLGRMRSDEIIVD